MIYIAYFSTDEEDLKHGPRHGSFSCLVDADDPEDAVKKFEKHLQDIRMSGDLFSEKKVTIFLNDIIEVDKAPRQPAVLEYQSTLGEAPPHIGIVLPSGKTEELVSYHWQPEDVPPDKDDYVVEPFLTFE